MGTSPRTVDAPPESHAVTVSPAAIAIAIAVAPAMPPAPSHQPDAADTCRRAAGMMAP